MWTTQITNGDAGDFQKLISRFTWVLFNSLSDAEKPEAAKILEKVWVNAKKWNCDFIDSLFRLVVNFQGKLKIDILKADLQSQLGKDRGTQFYIIARLALPLFAAANEKRPSARQHRNSALQLNQLNPAERVIARHRTGKREQTRRGFAGKARRSGQSGPAVQHNVDRDSRGQLSEARPPAESARVHSARVQQGRAANKEAGRADGPENRHATEQRANQAFRGRAKERRSEVAGKGHGYEQEAEGPRAHLRGRDFGLEYRAAFFEPNIQAAFLQSFLTSVLFAANGTSHPLSARSNARTTPCASATTWSSRKATSRRIWCCKPRSTFKRR
jgi:hypothetical protein